MVLYVSTTKFLPGLHVNGAGQIYFGVSEVIFKVSASPAAACLWQRDDQGTHLKRWKKSWVMILLSSRISNITIRSLWLGVLVRLMNKYVMAVLEVQFLRCKIKVFFPFDFGLDFDFDSNNLEQRRVPHHSESSFNHASDWGQKKTLSVGPLRVHSLPASFYSYSICGFIAVTYLGPEVATV